MATSGISQTGIDSSLINQKMNQLNQETQSKTDKTKDDPVGATDTVNLTANVSERPAIKFESLNEEQAIILAQLVANNLTNQPFGISTPAGMDALRTFM